MIISILAAEDRQGDSAQYDAAGTYRLKMVRLAGFWDQTKGVLMIKQVTSRLFSFALRRHARAVWTAKSDGIGESVGLGRKAGDAGK